MKRKALPIMIVILLLMIGCSTNSIESNLDDQAVSLRCIDAPVSLKAIAADREVMYCEAYFDAVLRKVEMTLDDFRMYGTDGHWTIIEGTDANLGPPPLEWLPEAWIDALVRIDGSCLVQMRLSELPPQTHDVEITESADLVGRTFENDGLQVMIVAFTAGGATVLKGLDDHVIWCSISTADLELMRQTWRQVQWRFVHVPPEEWHIEGLMPLEMMPTVVVYRKIS